MSLETNATCPPFSVVKKFKKWEDNSFPNGKQAGGDKGSSILLSLKVGWFILVKCVAELISS